ncbi:MAG: ROK family protein [Phycisphaerales bacterium]
MQTLGIDIGGTSVKVWYGDHDPDTNRPAQHPAQSGRTGRSSRYAQPSRSELIHAIHEALGAVDEFGGHDLKSCPVGLCLPGKPNPQQSAIEYAKNLPCLNHWAFDDLLSEALGTSLSHAQVLSDVHAAGAGYLFDHPTPDRLAMIAIGTGIGQAVFDDGVPVGIGDKGIGHLGMVDIGRLGSVDRVDADGCINQLESYLGARAIEQRFPETDPSLCAQAMTYLAMDDPIMLATVHMLKLVHAIYTPAHIVLVGGIGSGLMPHRQALIEAVNTGLTTVAASSWTLEINQDSFVAARGAALVGARLVD